MKINLAMIQFKNSFKLLTFLNCCNEYEMQINNRRKNIRLGFISKTNPI